MIRSDGGNGLPAAQPQSDTAEKVVGQVGYVAGGQQAY